MARRLICCLTGTEQEAGDGTADRRADICALGTNPYELLIARSARKVAESLSDVEQIPELPWLRSEVLIRCAHPRPEMRRRVPRPSWVVQDRARERYQIRVASAPDRLGLLELGDQPHRDHGHRRRLFHRARERHLIARAYWHIGAMMMRFLSSTLPTFNGVNSVAVAMSLRARYRVARRPIDRARSRAMN